jgi:hypothetical protein
LVDATHSPPVQLPLAHWQATEQPWQLLKLPLLAPEQLPLQSMEPLLLQPQAPP